MFGVDIDYSNPDTWKSILFAPSDLVFAEYWIDSAVGYILEPGLLGSEFVDDMLRFILPDMYSYFELAGDIIQNIKDFANRWNEFAAEYNSWRVSLLMIVSRFHDALALALNGLTITDELLGILEEWGLELDISLDELDDLLLSELDDMLEQLKDILTYLPPMDPIVIDPWVKLFPDEWDVYEFPDLFNYPGPPGNEKPWEEGWSIWDAVWDTEVGQAVKIEIYFLFWYVLVPIWISSTQPPTTKPTPNAPKEDEGEVISITPVPRPLPTVPSVPTGEGFPTHPGPQV